MGFYDIIKLDADAATRSKAALGLGNFINQSDAFVMKAIESDCCEVLLELLTHPNQKCQNGAARTLGLVLFKAQEAAISRVIASDGVETILKSLENEEISAEVKFPTAWCLSQIVEQNQEAKENCKNREGLLAILENLKISDKYERQDKSLLIQRLNILIELIK